MTERQWSFRRKLVLGCGTIVLLVVLVLAVPAFFVADFYWGSAQIDPAKTGSISGGWHGKGTWPRTFTIAPEDPIHADVVQWLNSVATRGSRRLGKPGGLLTMAGNTFEAHIRGTSIYLIVYGKMNHEIMMQFAAEDSAFVESLRLRVNAAAGNSEAAAPK